MNPRNIKLESKTKYNFVVSVPVDVKINDDFTEPENQKINRAVDIARLAIFDRHLHYNNISKDIEVLINDKDFEQIDEDRWFKEQVFLGSGIYSMRDVSILITRLKQALNLLGGLQQGGEEPDDLKYKKYINNVAADIFVALTGKEPENK